MKILLWPHPKLAEISWSVVLPPDPAFLAEMFATMKAAGGIGLSAIQVGVTSTLFVTTAGGAQRVFVNPAWYVPPMVSEAAEKKVPMQEGCLSTPGQFAIVSRYPAVIVNYFDEKLEQQPPLLATGVLAHVVQHECEHLAGEMYVDHLKPADRSRIMGAMMKLKRSGGRR